MITVGIDPDTKTSAIALMEDGQLKEVKIIKGNGLQAQVKGLGEFLGEGGFEYHRYKHYVIESQQIYAGGTKNPGSILKLAHVAGGLLGVVSESGWLDRFSFPTPREWKGSVPKQIHQARILSRLGWEYKKSGTVKAGYCYPVGTVFKEAKQNIEGAQGLKRTDWKHLVDAIGLAMWGEKQ